MREWCPWCDAEITGCVQCPACEARIAAWRPKRHPSAPQLPPVPLSSVVFIGDGLPGCGRPTMVAKPGELKIAIPSWLD